MRAHCTERDRQTDRESDRKRHNKQTRRAKPEELGGGGAEEERKKKISIISLTLLICRLADVHCISADLTKLLSDSDPTGVIN